MILCHWECENYEAVFGENIYAAYKQHSTGHRFFMAKVASVQADQWHYCKLTHLRGSPWDSKIQPTSTDTI